MCTIIVIHILLKIWNIFITLPYLFYKSVSHQHHKMNCFPFHYFQYFQHPVYDRKCLWEDGQASTCKTVLAQGLLRGEVFYYHLHLILFSLLICFIYAFQTYQCIVIIFVKTSLVISFLFSFIFFFCTFVAELQLIPISKKVLIYHCFFFSH